MSLVESFVNDGVDEGAAVEEHALVGTGTGVVFADFLLPVIVAFPEAAIADLLHFHDVVTRKETA